MDQNCWRKYMDRLTVRVKILRSYRVARFSFVISFKGIEDMGQVWLSQFFRLRANPGVKSGSLEDNITVGDLAFIMEANKLV